MKPKLDNEISDLMRKNPSNWKAGIFYFNPADPRIIVPKRISMMGWTLNFASPYAYISTIAIVILIIASSIFGN
ncbi:MAG: DUF5808 domain-containing protein [Salinivirgaceae bacterium]